MADITNLPEECLSLIISITSPRDACVVSVVSSFYKNIADGDAVWEKFLPSDYREIVANSESSPSNLLSLSKKEIFLYLCDNPILLAGGTMSFALDKESTKKCYMIGSRKFDIAWGDTPQYWDWKAIPESRFSEVAELNHVWWLEVKGKFETSLLSPDTNYEVYLVYKIAVEGSVFVQDAVELNIKMDEYGIEQKSRMFLENHGNATPNARQRKDGWTEIKMGSFFNQQGNHGIMSFSLQDFEGWIKYDLILEGVEFRPREIQQCHPTNISGSGGSSQPNMDEGDFVVRDGETENGSVEQHIRSPFENEMVTLMKQMSSQLSVIDHKVDEIYSWVVMLEDQLKVLRNSSK